MGLVATPDMAKRSKRTWAQLLQRDGPFQVASFPLGSALTASNITQVGAAAGMHAPGSRLHAFAAVGHRGFMACCQ